MPDKIPANTVVEDNVDNDQQANKETSGDTKEEQITNLNKALRAEREQLKSLKQEVEKFKTSKLEEKGEYKSLYETTKSQYEELQTKVSTYEDFFAKTVEDAKSKLPEKALSLFPEEASPHKQLDWINSALDAFTIEEQPAPARFGAVKGMVNPPPAAGSQRARITPEEFAKLPSHEGYKYLDQFVEKDPITGHILLDKTRR